MSAHLFDDKPPTQQQQVLDLLRERGEAGVTQLLALERCQCMRLAAVVQRLEEAGHVIRSEMIATASGKRVARYVLEAPADGWVQQVLPL